MIQRSRIIYLVGSLLFSITLIGQSPTPGKWSGVLIYEKVRVPFSFEVEALKGDGYAIVLRNGEERVALGAPEKRGDSVRFAVRPFDAFVQLKTSTNRITGIWEKPYRNLKVSLEAQPNDVRIKPRIASALKVEPRWSVSFKPGTQDAYPGLALWQQVGQTVTGTVMTEVGDFRYFEGIVDGDSLKVSSFDGGHGFYMLGKKTSVGWSGIFHFDSEYSESWEATPAATELRDPFDLVQMKGNKRSPYYDILAAGSGKNAIDVSKLEGKVVVIQLFGTWCPNSSDETQFLVDWYATKPKDVELIAVTFEPKTDKEYGEKRIADYKDYFGISYEIFLGGRMSKTQAAIAFPFMDRIEAFPTLVLLDKQGNARYIHSYFNGPATGGYYEAFKNEFVKKIDELIAE